jgi:hypothetical protein
VHVAGLGRVQARIELRRTTMVRSSPSDSINWMELSRPTVKGSTA